MSSASIARDLTDSLHLSQPPIAVCFSDSVPEGVKARTGAVPAGCRFWQEATTSVFATVPADHDLCSIGVYTHHLAMTPSGEKDLGDALRVFADLDYVRPEDVAAIPVLQSKPKVIVYGPLDSVPLPPDVVLLFVKADQTLILSEASQQMEGGTPPAMGRPACAVVPQAFNTGRTALSLGCCGARAYLDILTPDVALYAIPGTKLAAFTGRVKALAEANGVLTQFHSIRRRDVEAGKRPSVQESLAAMQ
ncbi:MAG TPA: DUF169 domain-containing protein [Bryobacteraceae bacterium]|nr:DUF169 domain-containing protein [Bryobacteraceae bacterium]